MNKSASPSTALGLLVMLALATPLAAQARSPVARHGIKEFKALVVQGERPEIVACMVGADQQATSDAEYQAITWSADVSNTALVQEQEDGDLIIRTVRLQGSGRLRANDARQPVSVVCEIRGDEPLRIKIQARD